MKRKIKTKQNTKNTNFKRCKLRGRKKNRVMEKVNKLNRNYEEK